ncbi:MAG: CPBP family intramembrane metalloprotease [Clostridia bacterium]|nr:CPBP family intramembrane metalloprotease [Oscillospiraceae bacterium]MBQ7005881.1 CPBP family intramembrane metalloprotease [Clostridia bacterium]
MNGFYGYSGTVWDENFNSAMFLRKHQEQENLKKVGFYTGLAILGTILIQNVLVVALAAFGLQDRYFDDGIFASGFDIMLSILSLLMPFMIAGRAMNRYSSVGRVFYLGGPYRKSMMLPAVVAGVGCCMAANIVTTYISLIFNQFGYEPSSIDFSLPEGAFGFVMSLFRVVIVAGVVEEVIMRGYTLGNLRFYGDMFAIAMSSVVFALIHGNFTQIPFALLSAFGLGYFSVKTGTLWTGVIIHIINNFVSVIFYYTEGVIEENLNVMIQLAVIYGSVFIGFIAFAYFVSHTKDIPLMKGGSMLSSKEKLKAYFLNVPMIISVLYLIIVSVAGITEKG